MMATSTKNPQVDAYIHRLKNWKEEVEKLRSIALGCGLTEQVKWGTPCYTLAGSNIVLIHTFKEYCAFLFFKGALLNDADGILIQQTKNVQAARQARFTSAAEITKNKSLLKALINQAIKAEKAGLKVELKQTAEYDMPTEFQKKLDKSPSLKTAFAALTPGRQRAYILYFSAPKQIKTREDRVEKYLPHILAGKGLQD